METADRLLSSYNDAPRLSSLYEQYRGRAGYVLADVLEYESNPSAERRSDRTHLTSTKGRGYGDGTVLISHMQYSLDGEVQKMTVCSGFAIGVKGRNDVVVTCAHTLEEVR
jgi:hypothetical protein